MEGQSKRPKSSQTVAPHYNDYHKVEKSRTTLLIIDPQNDFHPGGSLAISTASADAERIASLIKAHADEIDDIVVSLDTHQRMHIAHSLFWTNAAGDAHPEPFTPIPAESVERGEWRTADPQWQTWSLDYCRQLEKNGRFTLIIWPEHCLVGTKGHAVEDAVAAALGEWCGAHRRCVEYVLKGQNMLTEHYSALRADVERPDDPRTAFNVAVFDRLRAADRVVVCGQALSHCVAFTTRDLLSRWPAAEASKVVLLTDCCSPVTTFEQAAEDFVAEVTAQGATVTTSDKLTW